MSKRRSVIKSLVLGSLGTAIFPKIISAKEKKKNPNSEEAIPMVISTWEHGIKANVAAMSIIKNGGKAIDAVEAGVRIAEADPKVMSVALGVNTPTFSIMYS